MHINVTCIFVGDLKQALLLSTDTPSPGEESGRHTGSVSLAHRPLTRGGGRHRACASPQWQLGNWT